MTTPESSTSLSVFYDGACPLCRREIALYRNLPAREPVKYVDISDASCPVPAGQSREALLARFHVQHADGRMDGGARAFLTLWARLPYWRWLARIGAMPGIVALLELLYSRFLRLRPAIQRLAVRKQRL